MTILSYKEIIPLFRALNDKSPSVSDTALRTLVRLSLDNESWLEIARYFEESLRFSSSDTAASRERNVTIKNDRKTLIESAVYFPNKRVRHLLYAIIQSGEEEERSIAAHALARAHDSKATAQLIKELKEGPRMEAAEALCYVDPSLHKKILRKQFTNEENWDVKFWIGIALVKAGDKEEIEEILRELESGYKKITQFWGDPSIVEDRLMSVGQVSKPRAKIVRSFISYTSNEVLGQCLSSLVYNQKHEIDDVSPTPVAETEAQRKSDVPTRLVEKLYNSIIDNFPFESGNMPTSEDMKMLRNLESHRISSLITILFSRLIKPDFTSLHGGYPIFIPGNWIVKLVDRLSTKFHPDILGLFESFRHGGDHLRFQIAWTTSRAGLHQILEDLKEKLRSINEGERLAAIQLIEIAVYCLRHSYLPIFGGGNLPSIGGVRTENLQ